MNRKLPTLILPFLLACLAQATSPCRSSDYNVAGKMSLDSHSDGCGDNLVTQCWQMVQVFQCKDANKTAGTDGSISVWPLSSIGLKPDKTPVSCLEADADVTGSVATGFIKRVKNEGSWNVEIALVEFTLAKSTSMANMLLLKLTENQCHFFYKLDQSTSDILETAPMIYGRWSGAWSDAGRAAVALTAALVGTAILQLL